MDIREDLLEVLARRALTQDVARPEVVARRHASGGRTARENLADLVDEGSFVEYGRFVTAAQEGRRPLDELLDRTPADGIIGGLATIDGRSVAVLSYDYLVLAGTQGMRGHQKSDRLIGLIEKLRLPTVFFAAGGGGRPGDTDIPLVSALDVGSFALWARLSGVVPRIAVVAGNCFAGNAVIAGCSDLILATEGSSLGMAGPAMIAGGGLGEFTAAEVGPMDVQTANGVVDVLVADEAEAVSVARRLLGCFTAPSQQEWTAADQAVLRDAVPEREQTSYDVRPIVATLADEDSVTFLREAFAPELVTALGRIEGRTVGFVANQTLHMAGAVTSDAADKGARFLQLCDSHGFPVVSLVDNPGMLVGPEAERTALVRHTSRLLVAGAQLQVPLIGVVLRRGYGLGAQAMLGGSTHEPLLTIAWPGAHLGAMGLEGAVRLAMRKELAAIEDDEERERTVRELTAEYRTHAKALNVARHHEIDDVVDPAETRSIIAATLSAATHQGRLTGSGRPVDTW
jgi:acetyl-CoA carboxylase carboxyltransferase component